MKNTMKETRKKRDKDKRIYNKIRELSNLYLAYSQRYGIARLNLTTLDTELQDLYEEREELERAVHYNLKRNKRIKKIIICKERVEKEIMFKEESRDKLYKKLKHIKGKVGVFFIKIEKLLTKSTTVRNKVKEDYDFV